MFWSEIQLLIVDNFSECIKDRFSFARICFNLTQTDSEQVEMNQSLMESLAQYFEQYASNEKNAVVFNAKDINNFVGMLVKPNV